MSYNKKSKDKEKKITETTEVKKEETGSKKIGNKMVKLIAQQNANLPDGIFVAKGEEIEVTKELADRILSENRKPHFNFK